MSANKEVQLQLSVEEFEKFVDALDIVAKCVESQGKYFAENEVCPDCSREVKDKFNYFLEFVEYTLDIADEVL